MILDNHRITICEGADNIVLLISSNFYGCFRYEVCRIDIGQEMLTEFNHDPYLLKNVITDDESWVYGYDIETNVQSSQWKHQEGLRPKKVHLVKILLTVFFDCIMNSCYKVVRSIRNTTLKLFADWAKELIINA